MNGLKCMHTQTQLCMLSIRGSFHIKTDTEKEQSFHENVNKESKKGLYSCWQIDFRWKSMKTKQSLYNDTRPTHQEDVAIVNRNVSNLST